MPQNGNEPPMAALKATKNPENEAEIASAAKLCHIVKRADFEGYGFNLHSEKSKPGQFIGKVDANSPAELAGLKEGDRIMEVNGVPIGSETHKQVVQRIKAISCEVRLLLIDVDKLNYEDHLSEETQSKVQKIPGSANISSISMTSTKRVSESSSKGDITTTDIVVLNQAENGTKHDSETNKSYNIHHDMKPTSPPTSSAIATGAASKSNNNNNNSNDGSLQLPTTAAEMRAKLLSKKKYDPKNESVDLKKKFDIIQKL